MERYEMAELLSRKANVSLEEARAALEESEWDMLDAMVLLERRGKAAEPTVTVDGTDRSAAPLAAPQPVKNTAKPDNAIKNGFKQIWEYIKKGFRATLDNDFVILRNDRRILTVPVLVLIVLFIFAFWAMLIALIVGLFCRCSYRFEGRMAAANKAMEKIENVVDDVKNSVTQSGRDDQ